VSERFSRLLFLATGVSVLPFWLIIEHSAAAVSAQADQSAVSQTAPSISDKQRSGGEKDETTGKISSLPSDYSAGCAACYRRSTKSHRNHTRRRRAEAASPAGDDERTEDLCPDFTDGED